MSIPFPRHFPQANPIVVREGRARWRGSRAFWIALAYALILSSIMWYSYNDLSSSSRYGTDSLDEISVAAQRGHELFLLLSVLQTGIWLLIAPALTATSIAVERESGLLSAMLLSKLTPGQIVRGKLFSALSFVLLLIMVALPITAICFLMGGVSQGEFIGALAIQLATALCGASIGLAASAFQKRAAPAMGMTFGFIVFWIVSSGLAFVLISSGGTGLFARNFAWLDAFFGLYSWTNPLLAILNLVAPEADIASYPGQLTMPDWWRGWHFSIVALLLFSALRLWQTARILRLAPDLEEVEKTPKINRFFKNRSTQTVTIPEPKRDERWRIPIASKVLFGDAAMRRELAARWKIRRASSRVLWAFALPIAYGFYWYLRALLWLWRNPTDRPGVFIATSMGFLLGWILSSVLMSAGTISRERETGTWNGLRLTLLSERSILTAKVVAPVVACAIYSLPLLPLILFCWPDHLGVIHRHYSDAGLVQWLLALVLLLAVTLECSCLGVWWSQRARSTASATGATLGTLCVLWIVIPILVGQLLRYESQNTFENFMIYWHPFVGLIELLNQPSHYSYDYGAQNLISLKQSFMLMMLFHLSVATTFFALALRRFRRANRLERN